jgi:hypothetical protein
MILGLIGTEQFSTERFTSIRRSVLYDYPGGSAPLMAITSLLQNQEEVSDPEFSWYEKRYQERKTLSATNGGTPAGPFADTSSASLADNFTWTQGTERRLKVASTEFFRIGSQVEIRSVPNAGATTTYRLQGIVTSLVSSTMLQINPIVTQATVSNDTDANGLEVVIIGNAHAQGATGSSVAPYRLPVNTGNYCQIFRTSFSITGTAAKTDAKFDKTGIYKDRAKDATMDHMIDMEMSFMFGKKSKTVDGATNLPTYTLDGILAFLERWEAGTTYGNTAATADSDDNKRIIANSAGTMNEETYDNYVERLFRVTSNKANEKLCLCGNGFLKTLNQMYRSKSVLDARFPKADAYGMKVVEHVSSFGTIYYKTHPLFNNNSFLRNNGLFLDVGNMRYKYIKGRDTELLKHREPNDADYRKDEWLTECSFELDYPESCMYLQNVRVYQP